MHFLAQAAQPGNGGPSLVLTILPYLLFFILFYIFFVMMPMKKKQKQFDEMMKGLKPGDRIVTNSGMHGVITGIGDKIMKIRVANNVVVEMDKSAIAGLSEEQRDEKKEKDK